MIVKIIKCILRPKETKEQRENEASHTHIQICIELIHLCAVCAHRIVGCDLFAHALLPLISVS